MVSLPDKVYEDSGYSPPSSTDGGSSDSGSSSTSSGSDDGPAPGTTAYDEQATATVTQNLADQGFVADADMTSGSGAGSTRRPEEGTDFTELGEDVNDSPEVDVNEPVGGRFVGNVFDQIRSGQNVMVDTSEAGNRSPLAADAVAYGNEVAGADFSPLDSDVLDTSAVTDVFPEIPNPTGDGDSGLLGTLLVAAVAVVAFFAFMEV